jgi:hypothetical protein
MRFTIRDILSLTTLIGALLGWWQCYSELGVNKRAAEDWRTEAACLKLEVTLLLKELSRCN